MYIMQICLEDMQISISFSFSSELLQKALNVRWSWKFAPFTKLSTSLIFYWINWWGSAETCLRAITRDLFGSLRQSHSKHWDMQPTESQSTGCLLIKFHSLMVKPITHSLLNFRVQLEFIILMKLLQWHKQMIKDNSYCYPACTCLGFGIPLLTAECMFPRMLDYLNCISFKFQQLPNEQVST